jgi:hypothetical protein
MLPTWFGVNELADLEDLADMLREMPATVARRTRAVLTGENARVVGG